MNRFSLSRAGSVLLLLALLAACQTPGGSRMADLPLSAEPLTGKFVWHDLITDDPDAARRFYGTLFGWRFEDTRHPNGGDYTLILAGDHLLGGIVQLRDPEDAEYSRWLGYLSVPDVDRAVDLTRADGGEAVVGPLALPGIGRAAAVIDPQGAVVGFLRSDVGDPDDSVTPAAGYVVFNEMLAADEHHAAGFYARVTGADRAAVERRGGVYYLLRAQGRDRAGFMRRPDEQVEPFWLTHFAVADPAAAAEKAVELGGTVLLSPSPDLRENSLAVITDPTGAILALHKLPHR